MVEIKDISYDCNCKLFFKNTLIGNFKTNAQLNDIRKQVKKENILGYYIIFENNKIKILKNGEIHNWVDGFFDKFEEDFKELFGF